MASRPSKRHYAGFMLVFALQVNAADSIVTRVSSQNPAIKYGAGWANETTGRADGVRSQFMLSNYVATATYVFSGTGIAVFGSIHNFGGNGTNTTYAVDNASPSLFTIDPSHKPQDDVQFFVSPPLSDAQHTLVIKNKNRGSWLWFEYLQVTTSSAEAPTVEAPTAEAPTATPSSQGPQPTSVDNSHSQGISGASIGSIITAPAATSSSRGPQSTSSDNSHDQGISVAVNGATVTVSIAASVSQGLQPISSDDSRTHGVSGGVIAGIVIATCVFLALLCVTLFYVIRRKRTRHPTTQSFNHNGIDPLRVGPEMTLASNPIIPSKQQYPLRSGAVPNPIGYDQNFPPAASYRIPSTGTTEEQQQQHVATQSLPVTPSPPSQTTRSETSKVVYTAPSTTQDVDPPPY